MKKIALFSMFVAGLIYGADAAVPQQRRSGGQATQQTAGKATTARSAVSARSAVRTPADSAGGVVRSGRTTVARSAVPATSSASTVVARAAKQNVVAKGTKVQAAAKNVIVSEECQAKYDGCMDAFCMLDNETGGRCICSNRNAELDDILAQIEELDQMSYQMATAGVERLEMGADADLAMKMAKEAADKAIEDQKKEERASARRELDLSMWDTDVLDFEDAADLFEENPFAEDIEGKTGDALHNAAANICAAQMPECETELTLLKMMYSQKVRSDCAAYENSLNAQKKSSANKLAAAEQALRQTALDQYRSANKYDLGQCTVKFKECMIETGGCGEDFSNCATMGAMDATNFVKSTSGGIKKYKVKGSATTIEIYASTYDTLLAKKPLCEYVTKECTNVAGQVWETFLKEVAPQVKSAELIAEDRARQDCIGNISSCFQKACKDNIDPNDPDGSYDMCLTRPGTMLNVCKVPLNACGIDDSSEAQAEESDIWEFVVARLASMRVDSCTVAVKECLTSEDRCGEDYTQCVGLDTDTIVRMCPYDKLVGCQKVYGSEDIRGDKVYEELSRIVQGIFLNIDNNLMDYCQTAVDEAVVKVCGDSGTCSGLTIDENIGKRTLGYKICALEQGADGSIVISGSDCRNSVDMISDEELGRGTGEIKPFVALIEGTIYWDSIEINEDGTFDVSDYWTKVSDEGVTEQQKSQINSELSTLQKNIDMAIQTIESDPTVQFCLTGREVQGMKMKNADGKELTRRDLTGGGRFPEMTKQIRTMIANAALKQTQDNYYAKYDELNEQMTQDYVKMGERIAENRGENSKDVLREIARQACVDFAESVALPKSEEPPKNPFGKMMAAVALTAATVVVPWLGVNATTNAAITLFGKTISGVALGGVAVAGVGLTGNIKSGNANGEDTSVETQLTGSKTLNQWNFKETVTSTFEWDILVCHRCTRTQRCAVTRNPIFGKKYCKTWADTVESCVDTQF